MKTFIAVAFFLFVFSAPSFATNFFVSTNGSDSNNGTNIATPFLTIGHALGQAFNSGDSVFVNAGTYSITSLLIMTHGGVTLTSFNGSMPVIDASQLGNNTPVISINASNITVNHLEVANSNGDGIVSYGGSHIRITNNKVHDAWGNGISVNYNPDMTTVHDIIVAGNEEYHNCRVNVPHSTSYPNGIAVSRCHGVVITNNYVYENQGIGIGWFLTDTSLITDNIVRDSYGDNMGFDNSTHSRMERNFSYSTGLSVYYSTTGSATGVDFANEIYSFQNPNDFDTVVNNIFVNDAIGFNYGDFELGDGLRNTIVANNTFYNCSYAMFNMQHNNASSIHVNSRFVNNIFYVTASQTMYVNMPASLTGLTFDHNCWYGASANLLAGSGDVTSNPLLVNPTSINPIPVDYAFLLGSPCDGSGVSLSFVSSDFGNQPRTIPFDMGAFDSNFSAVNSVTESSFCFFPNPAENEIHLQSSKPVDVSVFDISGKIILHLNDVIGDEKISLSSITDGVYFICAGNQVMKLVIKK